VNDIRTRNVWQVLGRELKLGVSMGAMLGVLAFGRAWLSGGGFGFELGLAVMLSVLLVMAVSTVTGALLPMFFKRLGLDPAVMSSPFIATIIDIVTITLYFAISIGVYNAFILGKG
jgi:magnesium transporter